MTRPFVVVDGLTKRFGMRRGVSNVSFEIMLAEVFGFLGPNSAGKVDHDPAAPRPVPTWGGAKCR